MPTCVNFDGRRVVIMGLGRFGGGIGVTRWLARQGAKVVVTDQASAADLADSVAALDGLEVTLRLGGHDEHDLHGADLLVVSPAVNKQTSAFFKTARARGVPWSSEMNLFLERCPARVIGITGSVGKSTTTAMIGEILTASRKSKGWRHGRVWLGGNIGKSLLEDLPSMANDDLVVLELSSFQLEDAAALKWSPHIALITNIRENHLDRHGTMQAYADAKANIYRHQRPGGLLALPESGATEHLGDDWTHRRPLYRYGVDAARRSVWIDRLAAHGQERMVIPDVRLQVPGAHNLQNAAAALTVATMVDADQWAAADALAQFSGLAHRLEFVKEIDGVRYFNDSKATTSEAAMTALEAFDAPVIAIVGGSDKGTPFDSLGTALARRAKAVVCVGATRQRIAEAIHKAGGLRGESAPAIADSFDSAVQSARRLATSGDVVVLAPGCASYDMFKNYEERGERFRQIVKAW